MRPARAVVASLVMLSGCGGGGGGGAPAPAPAPAPAAKVALAAANYRNAATLAMGATNSAYWYGKLGIDITDAMINQPVNLFLTACPASGAMQNELLDKNRDGTFDPGDTLHMRWDRCKVGDTTITGLVRVELSTDSKLIPGGREYVMTITIVDLIMDNPQANPSSLRINFLAEVRYTHTATSDHTVIPNAVFTSGQIVGDSGNSALVVDYLQDYASQTYSYIVSGNVVSGALGGDVDFSTPQAFTGVVGEYPSTGRMNLTGGANSTARLAEEGAAASDNAAVFAAVDANGDGAADASDAQLAWTNVLPVQIFRAFPDQAGITLPIP